MRQVYALLGLVRKWGPGRVDAACPAGAGSRGHQRPAGRPDLARGTENAQAQPALPYPAAAPRFARDPRPLRRPPPRRRRCGMSPPARHHARAALAAASGQARPADGHLARAPGPGPRPRDVPRRVPRADPVRRGSPAASPPPPPGAPGTPAWTRPAAGELDATAAISYDHSRSSTSCSRCGSSDSAANALIMGPSAPARPSSPPRWATPPSAAAPPSISSAPTGCSSASRRRGSTTATTTEMRKLLRADLLILDDFCLQPMDAADTAAIYEIIVERHRAAATIPPPNREQPNGWP